MNRKSKAAEFSQEGYSLSVTGRNVEVTDAMKDYAMEKISKIERFNIRIIDVAVTMDVQKLEHRVDIVLKVDHIRITSQAATPDMYASIDKAADKIQAQLRKYHDRIREHQGKKSATIDMNVNVLRANREEDEDWEEEISREEDSPQQLINKYRPHKIVKQETLPLKILTYEEAIMKMELSEDVFLIFRSEEDRKLKVIYRRNDGSFGVIEPEA